jgi:predicted lipoprotein with Yx(FWY)xxD motif
MTCPMIGHLRVATPGVQDAPLVHQRSTHMTRIRPLASAAALAACLAAASLSACGGDDNTATGATAPPKTADGQSATIGMGSNGSLGNLLVDSHGRTVYLFQKDQGTKSACSGACAAQWPPVRTAGKPTVGTGLSASKVSTTKRSDGQPQVTYNGHPLYVFEGDHSAGDANGQGLNAFGAHWYVVSPQGATITKTNSAGGVGY